MEATRAFFEGDALVVDFVEPAAGALEEFLAFVGLAIEPLVSALHVLLAAL